jgi:DNA polymerase III epsilon subunit-like protein
VGDVGTPLGSITFAAVDLETSGLSPRRHRIVQIGVVVVRDGVVVDEWSSLVRLGRPWRRVGPRHIHGVRRSDLRRAPSLRAVLGELARRFDGDTVFVAHNAAFDEAFLERASRRTGVELRIERRLCTLHLSRRLDPERSASHRLPDVCQRYGVEITRLHDALCDARATAEVLPHLLGDLGVIAAADLDPLYESP